MVIDMDETKNENLEYASAVVTNAHRVQIPTEILKKVNIVNGNAYDVYCNGKLKVRRANKDGRLRVTEPSLPGGAEVNITVKDNSIYVVTV